MMAVIKIATLVVVYSLALVVQLVVLVQAERMDYRLCDDEGQFVTDGRPGLTYKGSFKYMQTDGCDDYTIEAFNELRKLVDCNNVCSIEHANKVVQYSSRYLASKQLIKKLPPQLANFALLYGMRLSERCKELMMDGRLFRTNYIQETKEAKMLASWTVNNNPRIAELLEMGKKRVELKMRLPSQYSAVLAELPASNQNYKPELKLKDSETLKAAQMICNRFIRPLYERSMLPVAHLARNGFNYHNSGYLYQYAEDDDLSRQTLRLPSRLVFVCECLKQFKLTEPSEPSKTSSWLEIRFSPDDSSDAKLSASPSKNQMAIEDIAEISFDTGSIVPFEWDSKNTFEERRHYKYYFSGIDEISYKTNTDHVDELGPAVAAYDAKGGEIAKLRSELFHKSAHYLAKKVSADIIKELISVAAIQAADAISQVKMLNKSWLIALHQDNHEVDSYRKKLIKQVCPELMSRFYWTVSAMNESDDPKIRELARRVETLIISLDVALSFKYQNEAAYTEVDRSSVLLSVSGNVVFIADELRLEHEPI